MRTPEDIAAAVTKRLEARLYDLDESAWPYRVTTQLPSRRELENEAGDVHRWNRELVSWAREHGCETETQRRVMGTPVELVSAVVVPDLACALGLADKRAMRAYRQVRKRFEAARARFGVEDTVTMNAVKLMSQERDLDFTLMLDAAAFFASHESSGLTARQVPLPGFSAKWLGGASSRRRKAVCLLIGTERLELAERPGEVRWRWLDPRFADQPERIVTDASQDDGLERPRYALVVENKDTYLWMPAIENAACIWGSGRAATRIIELLPWLQGPRVAYWGDMDADGLEILASLRAAGLDCESLLMGTGAYAEFERFGTGFTPKGARIPTREPKEGLPLTKDERRLYVALCTGEDASCLRIEQERIPLSRAADELRKRGWPVP